MLGSPPPRDLLGRASRPCSNDGRTMPSLYWALGAYAGENLDYPLSVRFHTQTIERLMELGIGRQAAKR